MATRHRPACPGAPTQPPRSHWGSGRLHPGTTHGRDGRSVSAGARHTIVLAHPHGHSETAGQSKGHPSAIASKALGVEELLAVTWAGAEVVLPASLAQVEVPTASPHQAEMLVPLRQGLGASAKHSIHHLAVDALALAAAPQLVSWSWRGDYRPWTVEEILCPRDSSWPPADLLRRRG